MKRILMVSLFFITSCHSMELSIKNTVKNPSIKPIDLLITNLDVAPEQKIYGYWPFKHEESDKKHFQKLSDIIENSLLEPFLKNKIKNIFYIIDPYYQNASLDHRNQLRKVIIDEFNKYVREMISLKFLSENLQSTSSEPKKLICNDSYNNFLSNIKIHCWNIYKNDLKESVKCTIFSGLQLTLLNVKYIKPVLTNEPPKEIESMRLLLNFLISGYAIVGNLNIPSSTYSYLTFSMQFTRLEKETNKITENYHDGFESLRIV